MKKKIITLTSDFGIKDNYVAQMKAVILNIYSEALLIDLTHEIEKFNVCTGAFIIASAAPYFPKDTIHVGVVDPSVGTLRRPIIIETNANYFIGPDNGLLILAAESMKIKQIRWIKNQSFMLTHVSNTFQGRDIFAPAAAHLANGVEIEKFGPEITDAVKPQFTSVVKEKNSVTGKVLHLDDFGNIITNINLKDYPFSKKDSFSIKLGSKNLKSMKLSVTYADAKMRKPLILIGSHGYLEVAINQGNAASTLSIKLGDIIKLFKE